jgi:hypothetical protein
MNLLVRETAAQVSAEGLPTKDTRDMAGTKYVQLTGDNVPAGKAITIKFAGIPDSLPNPANAGKPAAATPAGDQSHLAALGIGLAGVGLVLGAAYPLLRRRNARRPARASGGADGDWDSLVEAIATLDDEFDAGNLSEAEYRRQRAEKKARLQKMSQRLGRA